VTFRGAMRGDKKMTYWVGFKISIESEHIFLESSEDFDQAKKMYEQTKEGFSRRI